MLSTSSLPNEIRLRIDENLLTCYLDCRQADLEIDILDELQNEANERRGIRQKVHFSVARGEDLIEFKLDLFDYGCSLLPVIVLVGECLDLLILQEREQQTVAESWIFWFLFHFFGP